MNFELDKTLEILERTPAVLFALLKDVSEEWTSNNEGATTWTVFDVVGHLIHCEQTNWMNRLELLLSEGEDKTFAAIDMTAQFTGSKGKTLNMLLNEFEVLRKQNTQMVKAFHLKEGDLTKTGIHPKFGTVTGTELMSTWLVHDLDHLTQISRVMAKQYKTNVGPWIEYLKILKQ